MIEFNVRANKAKSCKFRDAEAFRYAAQETARKINKKRVIILVHGYSVKPERARNSYEKIAETWEGNLTDDTAIVAYSWPSSTIGAGIAGYHAARMRAKEAGRRLAVLIDAISDRHVNGHYIDVSVMAHSLGTVVAGYAMEFLADNPNMYVNRWDKAVFQAGDARVKKYRQDDNFGRAQRKLGIVCRNYWSKGDSVLNVAAGFVAGKRIGRRAVNFPLWSNVDAKALHGSRVRHNTYKNSERILLDSLTFLQ